MNKIQHPGLLIKTLCLDRHNLSITDGAKLLKILRTNLSLIIHGKRGISATMALRLDAAFNTNARGWLDLQSEYDLEIARKKKLNIKRVGKGKIKLPKTQG